MRRHFLWILVALASGCGRSELLDDLSAGSADATPVTDGTAGVGEGSTTGDDATAFGDAGGDDAPSSYADVSGLTDVSWPPLDAGCGPTTCQGCCNAQGQCVDSPTEQQCGGLGDQCTTCAPGEFCKGGCMRPQPSCGPSNCDGCCEGDYCADGIHVEACGYGGHACLPCHPPGATGECVPTGDGGGTCATFLQCTPETCTGCCSGNVCAQGTQVIACGTGGVACDDCSTHPGTTCTGGACR